MNKMLAKRLLALLLAVLMLPVWVPAAEAAELELPKKEASGTLIGNVNPLYQGVFDADDFLMPVLPEISDVRPWALTTYATEAQAVTQLRSYMKNRTTSFTLNVTSPMYDLGALMDILVQKACVHNGNPKEGDSLMWQWGRWDASYSRSWNGSAYEYTINLVFAYYTTAAQEKELDAAVASLINSLGLRSKSDYQKIRSVYDYICANVTYDYANLYDSSYTLKFSAYAALIDGTAVCQGYALLFYRLMLELGIDSRFIGGTGNGGPHGWNIVELDGVYYNLDSTWDAGTSYYSYFLTNAWNFGDHYRDPEYDTWEFHQAYPMAAEDYASGVKAQVDPYIYIDYCGDTALFGVGRDGSLTIRGMGSTYDYSGNSPWYRWEEHIDSVVVDEGITRLGEQLFRSTYALTSVSLPESLESLGYMAFYSCLDLRSVVIPGGVTEIERDAFGNCQNLSTIYFLGDAPEIDDYAFEFCTANVYYPKGNATWTADKRADYGGDLTWNAKQFVTITTQPEDGLAAEGATAVVTLEAEGDGLTYKWYFAEAGSDTFRLTTSFTGPTYSVAMSQARNGRRVYCVVTDKYGITATSDIVTLRMVNDATILSEPEDAQAQIGQLVKTTVKAAGKGLTYAWYVQDVGGSFVKSSNTSATYSYIMSAAKSGRQVYCVITDAQGNSVTTRTATLNMAATVTVQPKDITVLEGEKATVSFTAKGDGLTYKWYYRNPGGSKFYATSTFTGNTYSVEMDQSRNGRQVYCVVTDKYGNTAQTDTVTLNMITILEITRQPESVVVPRGVTLKVDFAVKGDGLTYKWYYKDVGDSKFYYTTTFTGNSYTAQMNDARNGRQVYCVVTDKYGNSVRTNTVTMTMADGPVITRQPESVTGENGQTVKVSFDAKGDGLTYKWYFKDVGDSKFYYTSTFSGNTYTTEMNEVRDGRQIYCVVTDKYGATARTETVTLTMYTSLGITRQPQSVTVANGKTVKIDFAVKGDGLTYKWYYKDAGDSKFYYTSTFSGNSYTTQMNSARNGRQVYCVVTDKYGNSVQTDTVSMNMAQAPVITRQPESVHTPDGYTLFIDFDVIGEGLTYKWYFKNAGASKFSYTSSFTSNYYSTQMSSVRDGRQVYCVVTDKYGQSVQTNTVTMTMSTILLIIREPESVYASDGETVRIDFEATGDGLTYEWYYRDAGSSDFTYTPTFTGNSYTTQMNAARDGREVCCKVTDKYGDVVYTKVVTMTMITQNLSEDAVYKKMIALKSQYPEGMHWTNDDFYAWNGGIFYGGYGCAGFAFILSDAAFGDLPARMVETNISIDTVRVGDILRVNNDTHSVIILEIHDNYIVIAEGNYNSSIHWGRTMTAAEVAASDYYMTRYPGA